MRRASLNLVALATSAALLAGCSISFGTGDPSPAPTPTTERITSDAGVDSSGRLLSVDDLSSIEDAPPGLREMGTDDLPVYENPDPRGPCGAELEQPRMGTGDRVMFNAEGVVIVEELFDLGASKAEEALASYSEDIDPDCPTFTSQTHTSSVQSNDFLHEVELPAEAGDAVATMSYVRMEGGLPAYAGTAMFRVDGTIGLVAIMSGSEIPDATLQDLTTAAVAKL